MKVYGIAYHDTFDEIYEWHLHYRVWVKRDDAQAEADRFETEGRDMLTVCTIVELDVAD